jgi:hypothetical protein
MAVDLTQGTKSQPIPAQRSKHKDALVKKCGVVGRKISSALIDRPILFHNPPPGFQEVSFVQFLGTRNLHVFLF